jgi:CrcB protein
MLWVALGGSIGSAARYGITRLAEQHRLLPFPLGTFIVNITGCLLIGIFSALAEKNNWLSPQWRLLLTTGLCGGFTTFSAFAAENLHLLKNNHTPLALLYTASSVLLGIGAVWVGTLIVGR